MTARQIIPSSDKLRLSVLAVGGTVGGAVGGAVGDAVGGAVGDAVGGAVGGGRRRVVCLSVCVAPPPPAPPEDPCRMSPPVPGFKELKTRINS